MDTLQKPYSTDVICDCLQCFMSKGKRMDVICHIPEDTKPNAVWVVTIHKREFQPSFLDRKDVRFKRCHGTCDTIFCGLHKSGTGVETKSA